MKKEEAHNNIWDTPSVTAGSPEGKALVKTITDTIKSPAADSEFTLDGLQNDFPTATELERFVYDQTGLILSLKGRANSLKYTIALSALNGEKIDAKYLGTVNPYYDKLDAVPTENLKPVPPRDARLPHIDTIQNSFVCRTMTHPDENFRAEDRKIDVLFRKYTNGAISYEALGPLDTRPVGEKQDKFGRIRPEYIVWVDPRTGEQLLQHENGQLTPRGKLLRAEMMKKEINRVTNQWDIWLSLIHI